MKKNTRGAAPVRDRMGAGAPAAVHGPVPAHGARSPDPERGGFEVKRLALLRQIADALLQAGVAQIPLRELAAQLGTSDRMLLYYFKDKDDLVRSSLAEISSRLAAKLGAAPSLRKAGPKALLDRAVALFAAPALTPFMTVWADLSALGSRGEEPFRSLASQSVQWWLGWLEQRLDVKDYSNRRDLAAAILTVLEGARLLEANAPGSTAGAVGILSRGLSD